MRCFKIGSATQMMALFLLMITGSACDPLSSTTSSVTSASGHISISSQPVSNSGATAGQTVYFSVTAVSNDGKNLTYQWYKNGVSLTSATGTTLYVQSVSEDDVGYYNVKVSDGTYELSSSYAYLSLSSTSPITISSQPADTTVGVDLDTVLSVSASSTDGSSLSYQWYLNGTAISGAQESSLRIYDATSANEGYYYVVISDGTNTTTSNSAYLDVVDDSSDSSSLHITISQQPSALSVGNGGSGYLHVTAKSNDSKALSYQWYKDGVAISGATSAYYFLSNASWSVQGYYFVRISDGGHQLDSSIVQVTFTGTRTPEVSSGSRLSASLSVGVGCKGRTDIFTATNFTLAETSATAFVFTSSATIAHKCGDLGTVSATVRLSIPVTDAKVDSSGYLIGPATNATSTCQGRSSWSASTACSVDRLTY